MVMVSLTIVQNRAMSFRKFEVTFGSFHSANLTPAYFFKIQNGIGSSDSPPKILDCNRSKAPLTNTNYKEFLRVLHFISFQIRSCSLKKNKAGERPTLYLPPFLIDNYSKLNELNKSK